MATRLACAVAALGMAGVCACVTEFNLIASETADDTEMPTFTDTEVPTFTDTEVETDLCPEDPNKTDPGQCGCGASEDSCLAPNRYEAEDCTSQQGCLLSSNTEGFTGKGFMVLSGQGSWLEWNDIDIQSAGVYALAFRYSNGGTDARPCTVIVNGQPMLPDLGFSPTATWSDWQIATLNATLLVSATNTIRLQASTAPGGLQLDSLELTPVP